MTQDRREFLETLAAAAIAGRTGGTGGTGGTDGPAEGRTSPSPLPAASDWDLSWTSRFRGPHRAVFDWYQPRSPAGVWRAGVWKQQVVEAFGVKPEDVASVLVIRHSAIPMIMSDEFWLRHKLGKVRKIKDEDGKKTAERNPYRKTIDGLLKNGGIVLACGFAFGAMVSLEAKLQQKQASEVRPAVQQEVIPGIILQPSGFFALLEAQRNGCGLFPADVLL